MKEHQITITESFDNFVLDVSKIGAKDISIRGKDIECLIIRNRTCPMATITLNNKVTNVLWDNPFSVHGTLYSKYQIQTIMRKTLTASNMHRPKFVDGLIEYGGKYNTFNYKEEVSNNFCAFGNKLLFKLKKGFKLFEFVDEGFKEVPLNSETLEQLRPILIMGV